MAAQKKQPSTEKVAQKQATPKMSEHLTSMQYLPRFFKKMYQTNQWMFLGNVFTRLIKALMPIAILWVGKEIIDQVVAIIGDNSLDTTYLYTLVAIEFGLIIGNDIFSRIISITDKLLGELYANSSSIELIQKTANIDLQYLEDSEFYDKLERARRQTSGRAGLLSSVLSQFQDVITIVSLISAIIYFYPLLIILLFLSILPTFINQLRFSRANYALQTRMTPERRELEYMKMLGATDMYAKEVKLFGLADFISGVYDRLAQSVYSETKKLTLKNNFYGWIFALIGNISYYGSYVFIIGKTITGAVSLGELTFLTSSFSRLQSSISTFLGRFASISENAMYLRDYFEFVDMDIDQYQDMFERFEIPKTITQGIEFQNIAFRYPTSETSVFENLSFRIDAGEKVALVGENGAGKTTLLKLMLRLYEPTGGAILLDGVDIRHYDVSEYQKLFGVVFQDFVRYYMDVKTNIAVGNIDAIDDDEKIAKAAEDSLAQEVIDTLPKGLDEQLGMRFKKGTELSGGQWQKLALARAYVSDAQMIILDEPTSALDARSEYEVFLRFIELMKGKTSVIISHRFSTVRMADRIIVLEHGEIIEQGTHEELMKIQDGVYKELFDLQAQGYQ